MKDFNTLEELREALMSEEGAVYVTGFRFRFDGFDLQVNNKGKWFDNRDPNCGFLFNLENWTRYEKPKKIVKESFEGFVSSGAFEALKREGITTGCFLVGKQDHYFNHKATITIEREVEE